MQFAFPNTAINGRYGLRGDTVAGMSNPQILRKPTVKTYAVVSTNLPPTSTKTKAA
jgi:hypothetical protein